MASQEAECAAAEYSLAVVAECVAAEDSLAEEVASLVVEEDAGKAPSLPPRGRGVEFQVSSFRFKV